MPRVKIELPQHCLFSTCIPVRITDINYGNHLSNNAVVEIIHEARMQLLVKNGFTELDICGTGLIMSDLEVEFKNESFHGEVLEVKLFAGEITKISFELFYEILAERNGHRLLIAKAKTGMVGFNYDQKKIAPLPEELNKILS